MYPRESSSTNSSTSESCYPIKYEKRQRKSSQNEALMDYLVASHRHTLVALRSLVNDVNSISILNLGVASCQEEIANYLAFEAKLLTLSSLMLLSDDEFYTDTKRLNSRVVRLVEEETFVDTKLIE